MKNNKKSEFAIAVFLFCGILSPNLEAAGEQGISAYDAGMGGSLTALADDLNSLHHNPAGLADMVQNCFVSNYGFLNDGVRPGNDVTDWSAGFGVPISRRIGGMGVSWRDISERGLYREQMITLGYGKHIIGRWSVGIEARYLNRRLDEAAKDTALFGEVDSTVGIDAGAMCRLGTRWNIGVMANGLNEPDQAVSYQNKKMIRSGISFRHRSFSLAGQVNAARSSDLSGRDMIATLAGEKWWLSRQFVKADAALRGAFTFGPGRSKEINAGASFRMQVLQFDYGFSCPVSQDRFEAAQGSHRLTLSFWFGQSAPNEKSKAGILNLRRVIQRTRQEIELRQNQAEAGFARAQNMKSDLPVWQKEEDVLRNIYALRLEEYWSKKDSGASLQGRVEILTVLIDLFKPRGIFVKTAEKELAGTLVGLAKVEKKWASAQKRYVEKVSAGADPLARLGILTKLARRFASHGAAMDFVKGELDDLEGSHD